MVLLLKLSFLRKFNLYTHATDLLTHCFSSFELFNYTKQFQTNLTVQYLKGIRLPQALWRCAVPSLRDSGFYTRHAAGGMQEGTGDGAGGDGDAGAPAPGRALADAPAVQVPWHPGVRCELSALLLPLRNGLFIACFPKRPQ